jgi:hypothetical protein
MDDLYPGMNIPLFSGFMEMYIYGSVTLGLCAVLYLMCVKEPRRVYKSLKRKNTDESPIIQA